MAALLLAQAGSAHAQPVRALGDPRATASFGRSLGDPWQAPRAPGLSWALDVSAMTSIPLSVGVEAQLQTPIGLTAQLSFGHTPNAYLGAVASILESAGAYGSRYDAIVAEGIGNGAWNVRAGVGFTWQEGLELSVGYTYLTASAPLTPRSSEAATGINLHGEALNTVPLGIALHALHARVGWRFVVGDHLVVRVALGWTQAVTASAHVDVPPELRRPDGPVERMERGFAGAATRYGFTPELVLAAGYRF